MNGWNKEEVFKRRAALARELERIAKTLGKSRHRSLFGPLAWGRYEHEPSGADSKDNALIGYGYLLGTRDVLMRIAQVEEWPIRRALENALNVADR